MSGSVSLTIEETIDTPEAVIGRMRSETTRLLDSEPDTVWRSETVKPGQDMKIWSAAIKNNKNRVVKSVCTLPCDAKQLYDYLCTPSGFKIIDPASSNLDDPPIETLEWPDRATIEYARMDSLPKPCSKRGLVVLNIQDTEALLFISKSIRYDKIPYDYEKRYRAWNTFSIRAKPNAQKDGQDSCTMEFVNWIEFGGQFPAWMANYIVCKQYFQDLYDRILEYLKSTTQAENAPATVEPRAASPLAAEV